MRRLVQEYKYPPFPGHRKQGGQQMLPHWKHLDSGQRKAIVNMIAQGFRLKAIAAVVGVDPTAVSKEIKRNRTRTSADPGNGIKSRKRRLAVLFKAARKAPILAFFQS